MKNRLLSTVGLWLGIFLVIVLMHRHGAVLLLTAFAFLTQREFYQLLQRMRYTPWEFFGLSAGVLLLITTFYFHPWVSHAGGLVLAFSAIGLSAVQLFDEQQPQCLITTLLGIVWIPFNLHFYILLMAKVDHATPYLATLLPVWVIAVAKFSDVGGLLIGSRIGRTRLSPLISPNKTVEGAVGGILTSILVGLILGILFNITELAPWWALGLFAIPIAVSAILSDLLESYIKRKAGAKDSGNLIPGIGGAFDLIDSLLLTGPVAFILFDLFIL